MDREDSKIIERLSREDGLGQCIADSGVRVIVVLYIASEQAVQQIRKSLECVEFEKGTIELEVVFELDKGTRLEREDESELFEMLDRERFFDERADDEHAEVGGTSMRFGFADGRLPVVLSHNTPNNSIYALVGGGRSSCVGPFPSGQPSQAVRLGMRNPFRIRAAQRSVSDEEFVKLFGSGVFDVMREIENPWEGLVFLRSAPGGGKTTLLRLLTPPAARTRFDCWKTRHRLSLRKRGWSTRGQFRARVPRS